MDSDQVEWGVVHRSKTFGLSENMAIIPNVSYGAFYWGEADLIAVSKAGFLTEGEIKVSISDLRAEFKKKKYKVGTKENDTWVLDIKKHIFIVPSEIKDKALGIISSTKSGLMYVSKNEHGNFSCFTLKEPEINKKAKKMDQSRLLKICRLICFRYWKKIKLIEQ